MSVISRYVNVGTCPTLLFPEAFVDPLVQYHAVLTCCRMTHYDVLEMFLPEDKELRKREIQIIKETGKIINYNYPLPLAQEGPKNPCSDESEVRRAAVEYAKLNLDFAAEVASPLMVVATPPDKGVERRAEQLKRFADFFLEVAEYARQYSIDMCLEPMERHRFKKNLLGPTDESADFILELQRQGASNAKIMFDTAHVPLMEEDMKTALEHSVRAGLRHVQLGDAVLIEGHEFYGHTHPPVGIQGGMFDQEELTDQLCMLIDCGYISKEPEGEKPSISWEVRPYPGVSPELSAQVLYDKLNSAFIDALARYK